MTTFVMCIMRDVPFTRVQRSDSLIGHLNKCNCLVWLHMIMIIRFSSMAGCMRVGGANLGMSVKSGSFCDCHLQGCMASSCGPGPGRSSAQLWCVTDEAQAFMLPRYASGKLDLGEAQTQRGFLKWLLQKASPNALWVVSGRSMSTLW